MVYPVPSKAFLQPIPDTVMPFTSFGWTHPSPQIPTVHLPNSAGMIPQLFILENFVLPNVSLYWVVGELMINQFGRQVTHLDSCSHVQSRRCSHKEAFLMKQVVGLPEKESILIVATSPNSIPKSQFLIVPSYLKQGGTKDEDFFFDIVPWGIVQYWLNTLHVMNLTPKIC